jgi:hypothetical protein
MKPIAVRFSAILALVVVTLSSVRAAEADRSAAERHFERGFFLQVHERNLEQAAASFKAALAEASIPADLRARAAHRLAQVQEDLAAADFARLMPPECLGYAELVEPGKHIERILSMMQLTGNAEPAATAGAKPEPIKLGNGIYLPADFTVSPALIAELSKLRGISAGITGISEQGRPQGLLVFHAGDCDLVRGVVETAVQVLEPVEAIEGFKTYRVPDIGFVVVSTRLVLLSDSREQLTAAIGRLRNPQAASLASSEKFRRAATETKGSLAFVFVDGQRAVERFAPQLKGSDGAMVKALLDLEHLESFTVALTTNDRGLQLRARLSLAEGHHNMIYALVRTAPATRRSLTHVPANAAGVLLIGLNPADPNPTNAPPAQGAPPAISAMDIGRELFHNIEEVAVFAAAPAETSQPQRLPELAAVIAVKDVAKSEALWNQILTLASIAGARQAKPPADVTIEGAAGRLYSFDGFPQVAIVRGSRELIIGTQAAVAASINADRERQSIAGDAAFAPLLARLTPDTSKALLVDVGRAVEIAGAMSGRQSRELRDIAPLVRDLKVSLVTDEAPNQLTITAEVSGLPKFRDIHALLRAQAKPGRVAVDR